MSHWLGLLSLGVILAGSVCGCDSNPHLAKVSGTVTMDGQPLPDVLVTFSPIGGGRGSTGMTDQQGRYTLVYVGRPGALIGEHRVSVTTLWKPADTDRSEDPTDAEEHAERSGGGPGADGWTTPRPEPIPARFNTQTELIERVEPGQNTIDLPLNSG